MIRDPSPLARLPGDGRSMGARDEVLWVSSTISHYEWRYINKHQRIEERGGGGERKCNSVSISVCAPDPSVRLVTQYAQKWSNTHVAIRNFLKGADTILTHVIQEPIESNLDGGERGWK